MSADGYARITLRIPNALHIKLVREAIRTTKSMNAEIVARIDASFSPQPILDRPTAERLIEALQAYVAKP